MKSNFDTSPKSITYPVYSANGNLGVLIGRAETATQAGELIAKDALSWDRSGHWIVVNLSNVDGQFAWTDSRLATSSMTPLLKLV